MWGGVIDVLFAKKVFHSEIEPLEISPASVLPDI
jgi:hypothetical protein